MCVEIIRQLIRTLLRSAFRVASGDIEALAELVALSAHIDGAIGEAVGGLRRFGYSWADLGARLGVTRQAAQRKRGCRVPGQ